VIYSFYSIQRPLSLAVTCLDPSQNFCVNTVGTLGFGEVIGPSPRFS
jgi:hypothetical protein